MLKVRATNCPDTQNGHDGLMGKSVVCAPLRYQFAFSSSINDPPDGPSILSGRPDFIETHRYRNYIFTHRYRSRIFTHRYRNQIEIVPLSIKRTSIHYGSSAFYLNPPSVHIALHFLSALIGANMTIFPS
jgi:hypothetical protein